VPEKISAALLGGWSGTAADFTAALQQGPLEAEPDPFKAWQRGYMWVVCNPDWSLQMLLKCLCIISTKTSYCLLVLSGMLTFGNGFCVCLESTGSNTQEGRGICDEAVDAPVLFLGKPEI